MKSKQGVRFWVGVGSNARRQAPPTSYRRGRAATHATQLIAPHPGPQTPTTELGLAVLAGGGAEPGAEAAAKAGAGLRPEPMAGA